MPVFALNIILMLAWVIVTADLSELNLIQGFVLGWAVLWLIKPVLGNTSGYFKKPLLLADLTLYFLYKLFVSSLRVAWDVVTPWETSNPGIVSLPLDVETEIQILLLSNLISLTPGSLSLDISEDRKTLFLHVMFLSDPDELIKSIKQGMEKRVLELTR